MIFVTMSGLARITAFEENGMFRVQIMNSENSFAPQKLPPFETSQAALRVARALEKAWDTSCSFNKLGDGDYSVWVGTERVGRLCREPSGEWQILTGLQAPPPFKTRKLAAEWLVKRWKEGQNL